MSASGMSLKPPATSSVVYLDKSNPRSLVNIVPDSFARAMEQVPAHYLGMEEKEFKSKTNVKLTPTDRRLRTRFWDEYDRAQSEGRNLVLSRVAAGVCAWDYFLKVTNHPEKMAYLLIPVADYVAALNENLVMGVEKLCEILQAEVINSRGQLNAKAAEVILKVVQFIDTRLYGLAVQRIENKNLNLNVSPGAIGGAPPQTMEELNKRLGELQQKLSLVNKIKEVKDVESE